MTSPGVLAALVTDGALPQGALHSTIVNPALEVVVVMIGTLAQQAPGPGESGPLYLTGYVATYVIFVLLLIVIVLVFVRVILGQGRRFWQYPFLQKQSESEDQLSGGVHPGRTDQRTETAQPTRSDTMPRIREASVHGIFISYRRQGEPNFAGRLYDRLLVRFGRDRVFIDVDSIEPGLDFADVIHDSLNRCCVVLVIIGKEWLGVADSQGQPRLHSEDDYVRLEIEAALARKIRVIPMLIEGATMPRSTDLPSGMDSLARRNAIEMSHARFGLEAERLIETLERVMESKDGAV